MDEDISPEEIEQLDNYLHQNYPKEQEKTGLFQFFKNILSTKDTSKVGNIDEQEMFAVRTLLSGKAYSELMGLHQVSKFLHNEAEIILGTSDSKFGFLINAAITTKQEKQSKIRTGKEGGKTKWFQKNVEPKE